MRLGIVSLAALGIVSLATASAFADDAPPAHDGFRPHISVQITPPGGYASPGYGAYPGAAPPAYPPYGGGPGYAEPGQRWSDPRFFSARIDRQLDGIEGDLRDRLARGAVSPRAIDEFEARRRDIDGDVRAAARDGVITPDERDHIREDVDSLRFLEQRYRTGYGGGPGYGPRPWGNGWQRGW